MDTNQPSGAGSRHLSDEELALLEDGELPQRDATHLASCAECAGRRQDAREACAAYIAYRDSIRAAQLPPPPKPWKTLNALIAEHQTNRSPGWLRWWRFPVFAAGACAMLGLIVTAILYVPGRLASIKTTQLLTASAKVSMPQRRFLSLRLHGRSLVRPAVLSASPAAGQDPDFDHLRTIFDAADYSWQEPLNARSFQTWRSRLRTKRDSVSLIRRPNQGESYRVRTETDSGILHRVSLTLRAEDLRPVSGDFDFEGDGTLSLAETPDPTESASAPPGTPAAAGSVPAIETPVGPEDVLHVLAALDAIGADVGEPVAVSEDPRHQHVVISGAGVSPERRQQIAAALKAVPRAVLEFGSRSSAALPADAAPAERYAASMPTAFRQRLEERLGGPTGLQQTTDRVLETSASVVARAHALEVLARAIPPRTETSLTDADRDILHNLRDNHIAELERLISRIKDELKPLFPASANGLGPTATDNKPVTGWQAGVPSVVALAQETDRSLNRLLAGSYSEESGEEMLRSLATQMEQFNSVVRSERQASK